MKIVHTSDWHAGRLWKGLSRLDELEACLDHLAGYVERNRADLLLVTGDVFDSGAPAARAERAVFEFFKRIGQSGAHTVVIAGNHDSAERIEAWSLLAEFVNVHALGRPRGPRDGGVLRIDTRCGERATVAAVPFASPRRLVSALELAEGAAQVSQVYAERMAQIVELLTREFSMSTVNLLCLHTHLEGAVLSQSERQAHVGEEWAAQPARLPANAHYIALGHIHKPQSVPAPSPAYYAGSPLQLDFGEVGQEKSFVVIDAQPGPLPAAITRVPYTGAKLLAHESLTLAEIEERAEELRAAGWLRFTVRLEAPDPDINRKVRALVPNTIRVDTELPRDREAPMPDATLSALDPASAYEQYCLAKHKSPPAAELLQAFRALHAEAGRTEMDPS